MASTANTPKARALGAELKKAREEAGLSTHHVGEQLGRSHSHISRWERGRLAPSTDDTSAVLAILGVNGPDRERILKLAREASDPNWVAPGVVRHLAVLTAYEEAATRITNVEPTIMPGLLQTREYARSIMLAAGATSGEADQRVKHRMGRREILTRNSPVHLDAVIGEQALRYPPCEPSVMLEQLRHLQKWGRMDNVTVQAVPLDGGYSPALEGAFVLIEFEKDEPVVQLEHYRSATTLTDTGDVQDYRNAADSLRQHAMSPTATEGLIAQIADDMESTT